MELVFHALGCVDIHILDLGGGGGSTNTIYVFIFPTNYCMYQQFQNTP